MAVSRSSKRLEGKSERVRQIESRVGPLDKDEDKKEMGRGKHITLTHLRSDVIADLERFKNRNDISQNSFCLR